MAKELVVLLLAAAAGAAHAGAPAVEPGRVQVVARSEVWVDAGGVWTQVLPEIRPARGQRVLLSLKARLDTAGRGGCNFVFSVAVNGCVVGRMLPIVGSRRVA